MNDKELIELAAKSIGYKAYFNKANACQLSTDGTEDGCVAFWNPIADDGDCARLEANLGIMCRWYENGVGTEHYNLQESYPFICEDYADHGGDRNAARRKASTRCAAEIGRGMA